MTEMEDCPKQFKRLVGAKLAHCGPRTAVYDGSLQVMVQAEQDVSQEQLPEDPDHFQGQRPELHSDGHEE